MLDPLTLHVLAVLFLATLIRSAFGFGEALIAVPLLALRIPLAVAAPLAVLVSVTVAGVVVVQDWRSIHLRSAGWLIASTLAGIPLGIFLLTAGNEHAVKAALGAFIVAFSVYSLTARGKLHLQTDSRPLLLACGFSAGVLGGAYGMNGPPLVIYGALRRWSAQHFRATLQAYFLPASGLGLLGYWLAGLWGPAVTKYYLLSLPEIAVAVLLGRWINQRLSGEGFLRYLYVGLIGVGAVLLVQAL